jgi:hypothetical protein
MAWLADRNGVYSVTQITLTGCRNELESRLCVDIHVQRMLRE